MGMRWGNPVLIICLLIQIEGLFIPSPSQYLLTITCGSALRGGSFFSFPLFVLGLVLADDLMLDLHHGKVEFYLCLGGAGAQVAPHHLGQQVARALKQRPLLRPAHP